jgi:hypothetical protein
LNLGPVTGGSRGLFVSVSVMTSDDSLLLLLRRLDEIERKLYRMMEELEAVVSVRGVIAAQQVSRALFARHASRLCPELAAE